MVDKYLYLKEDDVEGFDVMLEILKVLKQIEVNTKK